MSCPVRPIHHVLPCSPYALLCFPSPSATLTCLVPTHPCPYPADLCMQFPDPSCITVLHHVYCLHCPGVMPLPICRLSCRAQSFSDLLTLLSVVMSCTFCQLFCPPPSCRIPACSYNALTCPTLSTLCHGCFPSYYFRFLVFCAALINSDCLLYYLPSNICLLPCPSCHACHC